MPRAQMVMLGMRPPRYSPLMIMAGWPQSLFAIGLGIEEGMTMVTITTDGKWKPLRYRSEVPERVLAAQFDYQDAEEALDGFFRYRGHWHHLDGFLRCDGLSEFKGWHAYAADSYFSGVVIRISKDGDDYQVGTYTA